LPVNKTRAREGLLRAHALFFQRRGHDVLLHARRAVRRLGVPPRLHYFELGRLLSAAPCRKLSHAERSMIGAKLKNTPRLAYFVVTKSSQSYI
jgi:hypothetical protein